MFLFPVLYISNTFISIHADPSNADFWIKVIDVPTPMPFKLPFNRNGTVRKALNIRPYSYSRYWTGTSLQWRLMLRNILESICI